MLMAQLHGYSGEYGAWLHGGQLHDSCWTDWSMLVVAACLHMKDVLLHAKRLPPPGVVPIGSFNVPELVGRHDGR